MLQVRLKLDYALEQRKMSRYALSKKTGIHYQIVDNYYKNKVTRYDSFVLAKICTVLNCDICDILEIVEI